MSDSTLIRLYSKRQAQISHQSLSFILVSVMLSYMIVLNKNSVFYLTIKGKNTAISGCQQMPRTPQAVKTSITYLSLFDL